MNAIETINQLRARGIKIHLVHGYLRATGTSDRHLTDEQRALIRQHKAKIIAELQREGSPYPNAQGLVKCRFCQHLQAETWCKANKIGVLGTSLVRDCKHFVMASAEPGYGKAATGPEMQT
jgi:hypothetical protein